MAKEPFEEMRARMIKKAKEGITSAYSNEEHALMQAINAYLETNKSYNLVFERLSEWYGIYFPEIKMSNPKALADLAIVLNSREGISKESITSIIEDTQKADSIYNKAKVTIGREMSKKEREAVLHFARLSNQMYDTLLGLEAYIKATSTEIMPNTTYLTDEKIAAELLSKAGSLARLASMPASTVQLLGAEKALFKHIKFGSNPPKYGVLFKLAEISNGPRDKRGRIARVYAAKICIALKADYFTKNFIAEKLKSDIENVVQKIKESPARERSGKTPNQFSKPFHGRTQRGQGGSNKPNRFSGQKNRSDRSPKWHKR
jgi:nucleolar protein 56